jgi:hypothetical protein
MKYLVRNYTPTKLDIVKKWACNIFLQLEKYKLEPGARKAILIPTDQLFDFAEATKENTPRAPESLHRALDALKHTAMLSEREDGNCAVVIQDFRGTLSEVLRYGAH